jgi:pyruvate/2-oxoglutarate dehydrogenase complex dihydrolipoamide dehydrogenase (E3) component
MVGSKPYPYVLHRAHEIAVVGLAEKEQITNMINVEVMKQGFAPGEKSQKQGLKDLEGRKWKEK